MHDMHRIGQLSGPLSIFARNNWMHM